MKKLKLSLIIVLVGMASFVGAQTVSLNIKGGLNMSDVAGDAEDTKLKPSFHIGIGTDYELNPNMAIQSGLFFTSKGTKVENVHETDNFGRKFYKETTINANFLQLPVHFAYKIDTSQDTKVVLHAGPYIAYGVGGKTKYNVRADAKDLNEVIKSLPEKMDTFDKDKGLKRFDAGIGFGIGAELSGFIFDLGYEIGFANLGDNEVDINSRNTYLSIGYKF